MGFVTMKEDAEEQRDAPSKGGFVPLSEDEKPKEERGLVDRGVDFVRGLFKPDEPRPRGAGLMYDQASQEEKNQALARDRSPVFKRPAEARPIEGPEPSVSSIASDLVSAPGQGLRQVRAGIRSAAGDLIGSEYLRRQGQREAAAIGTEQAASQPEFENEDVGAVYGGLRSLVQQAPGMALGVIGRTAAIPLAQAGLTEAGDEYTRYRARGAAPGLAAVAALGGGATEVLTELAPMGVIVNKFGKQGAARFLADLLAKDVPGEQVATLVEDAIDTATHNPDKTWLEYFQERPKAAWQTLLATFGQAGAVGAAHVAARGLERLGATPEATEVGKDAARVAKAAGKASGIDLTQLSSITDEKGRTVFETPSGDTITKEQWDGASKRVREAWLQPAQETAQSVPRETPDAGLDTRKVVNGVRVDEDLEAAPAPEEGPEAIAYPDETEQLEAAPPPKSARVQELERLASQAETAESRQELQRQAQAETKKAADELKREAQADDLMKLASKTKNPEIAAGLRERALKLRGAEPKAETEKPASKGLRAREETVEHVEAKPVKEPTTEEVNKRAAQVAEEDRPEPVGPSKVMQNEGEPLEVQKARSKSKVLSALQRLGGIHEGEMADLGIEKKTGKKRKEDFFTKKGKRVKRVVDVRDDFRVGDKSLFRKDGKLGMDQAAEWLQQNGYLADQADHERAREIIRGELEKPGSMRKLVDQEQDMIDQAARDHEAKLNEATVKEAEALGIETEGRPIAEVERALVKALDADWTTKSGLPQESIEKAAVVRRAVDLDEQATHDAAVRHGDDEAGFIKAAQEIIDAHEKRSAASGSKVAEPAADTAGRSARTGEGKPQAASPEPRRETAVRSEQRVRAPEPGGRAEAGREQSRPERNGEARPVSEGGTAEKVARVVASPDVGHEVQVPDAALSKVRDARSAARWLVQNSKDPATRRIARRIMSGLTPDMVVAVHDNVQTAPDLVAARFGRATAVTMWTRRGSVEIHLKRGNVSEDTLLHELVHGATIMGVHANAQLRGEMESMLGSVRQSLNERGSDNARFFDKVVINADELLAYGLTSPTFSRYLQHMTPDGKWIEKPRPEQPTMWQRFVRAIANFLGISRANVESAISKAPQPTLYKKLDSLLQRAMVAHAQAVTQAKPKEPVSAAVHREVNDDKAARGAVTQEDLEAAGADAKKMADHKDAIDAKIKDFLGERAYTWMEQHGLLRPAWSWDDTSPLARDPDVPAYTGVRDGKARAVLFYDRIADVSHVPALLMHEIGTHFGMKRMLGEEKFAQMLNAVKLGQKDGGYRDAWERVKRDYVDESGKPFFPEGSDPFVEEVAAAVVEQYPRDTIVRRMISQVRAWVHQNISPRLAGKMDESLLKGLALAALRKAGRGELSAEAMPAASADQAASDVMMARPGRQPPPKGVSTTQASVAAKWLDFLNRQFIDSFSQLKKSQLGKVAGTLVDHMNAYAREQLMHGRATERLKDLGTDYLAPMIKIAGEAELTREDVSDGLYAMHAPEANRYIASINTQQPDGGSGLTDRAAQQILASYTPEQRKALDKIDKIVQRMNSAKLDRMVSEGLITPKQRADMQARYKHWLSMKQMDDDENFGFGGNGLSVKGKEFQARMGRFSQAEDPLSMTIRDAMYGVMRAEKNRVATTFFNFAKNNPNAAAWEEVTPANMPTQRIHDPATGQVKTVPDPLALWREPEYFGAKINGEQKWIRIKDKLLAEQMKKLGDHGLDSDNELVHNIMQALNGATRMLSRFYTQFSPDFALVNPIRDVQQGALVVTSFDKAKGKQLAARMMKNLPGALKDAAIANFQEMQGKHPSGQLYEQFRQDGGTTGGYGLDDARTIQKQMERAMAALGGDLKAKAALGAQAMLKPIMALNDSFENMTRFATYKAALQSGFTREQAAVMAKNVTVNFNKRGQASPVLNALYAFFNASMQANMAALRSVAKSRTVQVASTALFAAGAYAALSDAEDERGMDESERVSEFVQDRNVVVPYGEKKAVKIPLAYGFNIPYATGRHLVRTLQGKETVGHMLGAIAKLGLTTFLPTDSPVPTVAQPIADVVSGTDFAGRRIAQDNPFDNVTPKSSQYRDNANVAAVQFFKALNAATGGSEHTKGGIDVSPEKATYLVKQYLGGLAAPLELAALPFAEKSSVADIPVARRFVAEAKDDIYVTKAARIIREADARRKELEEGEEAKPGEEEFVQTVRAYESALRRLTAARSKRLKEDKKADVSEIDEQRNLLADQVLTARRAYQQQEAR